MTPTQPPALTVEQIEYLDSLWEKAQQPMSLRADALQANKDREEFIHAFLNSWPFIKLALSRQDGVWVPREKLLQALARGYCQIGTENEVMNPHLVSAMADEIEALLRPAAGEERE